MMKQISELFGSGSLPAVNRGRNRESRANIQAPLPALHHPVGRAMGLPVKTGIQTGVGVSYRCNGEIYAYPYPGCTYAVDQP